MSSDPSKAAATEDQTMAATQATVGPVPPSLVVLARGETVGRYLVLGELGHGTMGAVFDAYDADLDRRVALKLIAEPLGAGEGQRQRLLVEAQLMAKISHPNVVTVFDVGVWRDRLYLAMELVEGITLDQWCALPGRTTAEVLDAFMAAANGLAAAHDAGVVHRDFKPNNVLVSADARVRVADFGIAERELSESAAVTAEDPVGGSRGVGTPAYMSPEQWARGPVDARSDQFSYCVALFEVLFGKRPFVGASVLELAAAVSLGRIVDHDPARVDARVRAVVLRGLARVPGERHASMHALVEALRDARRPRWRWRGAAVAAALVAAAGSWAALRPSTTDACRGTARIDALWSTSTRQAIDLDRADVTPAYAEAQREALLAGLERYAERWNELRGQVCRLAAESPSDAATRSRQSCTEDRFAALSGTITALREHPIDPTRVDRALDALPDLDACAGETPDWEPVPADPEQAREVAALRDRLVALRIERSAGRSRGDVAAIETLVADAEAIGFRHLVIRANIELAAQLGDEGRGQDEAAAVQRALLLATLEGDDELLVSAINRLLLQRSARDMRADELRRWATLADAIARRADLDGKVRGDLQNNLGLALRALGDIDGALVAGHDAEAAYAAEEEPDGILVTRARINRVGTLLMAGRSEEARIEAERVFMRIDELQSPTSAENIDAAEHLAAARLYTGDRRGSVAMVEETLRRRILVTGPSGRRVGKTLLNLSLGRAVIGDLDGARAALDQARIVDPGSAERIAVAEVVLASQRRDSTDLRRALEALRVLRSASPEDQELAIFIDARDAVLTGQPRRALALLEPVCGTGEPVPPLTSTTCCATALIAATLADDAEAEALWLARLDRTVPADLEDRLTLDIAVAAARRLADPAALVGLRARFDAFVAGTHRDHPSARLFAAALETLGGAAPTTGTSSAPPSRP